MASHVVEIGGVKSNVSTYESIQSYEKFQKTLLYAVLDPEAGEEMMKAIDTAKENGDSIGGIVEVIVEGNASWCWKLCTL